MFLNFRFRSSFALKISDKVIWQKISKSLCAQFTPYAAQLPDPFQSRSYLQDIVLIPTWVQRFGFVTCVVSCQRIGGEIKGTVRIA